MKKVNNIVMAGATGLILGLVASVLSSYSIWLNMRLHSYDIVWGFLILMLIVGIFIKIKPSYFFLLEAILLIMAVTGRYETIIYNFSESFLIGLSIHQALPYIALIFIAINVYMIYQFIRLRKGKN